MDASRGSYVLNLRMFKSLTLFSWVKNPSREGKWPQHTSSVRCPELFELRLVNLTEFVLFTHEGSFNKYLVHTYTYIYIYIVIYLYITYILDNVLTFGLRLTCFAYICTCSLASRYEFSSPRPSCFHHMPGVLTDLGIPLEHFHEPGEGRHGSEV